MGFGLFDQLQIFRKLYLIGLLGLLIGLGYLSCSTFGRVWQADLLHKLNSFGISGSSIVINRWLWVILDWKSSQENTVNAGVTQGSIPMPTLFLLYINDLPDHVICNIAIYADNTILCFKCDQASNLWQQQELAFELESDL